MNIIIAGPIGSGKGTQSKLIAPRYGLNILSTGDIWRSRVAQNDPEALAWKERIGCGELFTDNYVNTLMFGALKENNVFDGYPRTVSQAATLDELVFIDRVFLLHIQKENIIKRLGSRQICVCGKSYGPANPAPAPNHCVCGKTLFTREEDKPHALARRFQEYDEKTIPAITLYEKQGILIRIDADQNIPSVCEDIASHIDHYQRSKT